MRYISPKVTKTSKPGHRVQVRPVNVNLTTRSMDSCSDIGNGTFIHTVGRRIRNHQRGKSVSSISNLGLQILHVNVADLITGHHDNTHACQHCRCGVGTVCTGWNQAHGALSVTIGEVIATNGEQSSKLTLASGVGLKRDGVISGDINKPLLQLSNHLQITSNIFCGSEGVNAAEFRPGDRFHFGGRV